MTVASNTGFKMNPFNFLRMSTPKFQHTFFEADFPAMASHCPQAHCGFSLYRNVLVQWDEDHDERVFIILDEMKHDLLHRLLIVQEHKGSVALVWADSVPAEYKQGAELFVDGDIWYVVESNITRGPPVTEQQNNSWHEDMQF